jgi:hypothetical protein
LVQLFEFFLTLKKGDDMNASAKFLDPIKTEPDADPSLIRDWSHFVNFRPQLYFRPQDMEDLKRFLESMLQKVFVPRNLRVLGGLHSCSEICVSDGIIDVSDLPQSIEFGSGNASVTVSANWHLHDFLLALSRNGKSISATGGTDHQTLAGLISTATAPATPRFSLYDLLEWVEYLTIAEDQQTVVEKRVHRSDPEFAAVIGSLGAVGIITKVNFNLIDEPYFETIQKVVRLDSVLSDLEKTSRKYDFWRIDWVPDTDTGLLWAAKRIPTAARDGDYPQDQSSNVLTAIFQWLSKVETAGPILDDAMRVIYAGLAITFGEVKARGPLRNMLPVDRRTPLRVAMAEWSFDPSDLQRLMDCCKAYFEKNGWPNLPIEIELTKTSRYFMSPWNWPGLDYIVKFNFMYMTNICETAEERGRITSHLRGLWDHLLRAGIQFKAHWGKINFMDVEFVRAHYEIDQFRPFIRPIFLNHYLSDRLGPLKL